MTNICGQTAGSARSTVNNYKLGDTRKRPWGKWEVIAAEPTYIIKKLLIDPGGSLSLQFHHNRDEHWFVVDGTVTVTKDSTVFDLSAGQSADIPRMTRHCLENRTHYAAQILEVQTGDILDEADITRLPK